MREDIINTRREKLARIEQVCGTAYPEQVDRTMRVEDALQQFATLADTQEAIALVGRVRSLRMMGKIAFAHLEDESGKLQVFAAADAMSPGAFQVFADTVDIGDFLSVRGVLFLTKKGEQTIKAQTWRMLSKSLRPIPTEHFGFQNEEERLRRRYLDLLANPDVRELFRKKTMFWHTIQQFLVAQNFLAVSTPVLEHIPGGAEAEPFVTHHQALDTDFYLRISLELALKRLLVGGYERVFEIGRVFRNEGIDREHLQEFDHMEFYAAYMDLATGMALVEDLYKKIVHAVVGPDMKTVYEGETIDWSKPFPRVDYFDLFAEEFGIDLSQEVTVDTLRAKADERSITYEATYGKGRLIDLLYKKTIRQKLIQPCFLVGHPIEVSPLAKTDPSNPRKTLRMQPVAAKSELGNGFAELNDPMDQRERFEEQMKLRADGDTEGMMLDEDFLEALEYGMPPAFGFGMSERFFAILMDRSIRETVLFPPMKDRVG